MQQSKLFVILLALTAIVTFQSCDKSSKNDDTTNPPTPGTNYTPGTVILEFSNMANTHSVDTSGKTHYSNALSQAFNVTKWRYYVSNVVLINSDGLEVGVPNIYQLIDADSTPTRKITCPSVPGGTYTAVRFMVGVDPARVAAGNFTGYLDPANNMFINSTDGFYALQLEGYYFFNSNTDSTQYTYKIGGLGANSTLRTITVNFPSQTLIVNGTRNAQVHVFAEVLDFFTNPTNIDLITTNNVTTLGPAAVQIADNYADMFTFNHIHN